MRELRRNYASECKKALTSIYTFLPISHITHISAATAVAFPDIIVNMLNNPPLCIFILYAHIYIYRDIWGYNESFMVIWYGFLYSIYYISCYHEAFLNIHMVLCKNLFHIFYNNLTLNGFQTLLDSILYSTVSWEYMEKLGHKVNRFMGYDIRLCRAIWSNIVEAIRILMNYALRLYRIKVLLHIQICCLYVVEEIDDALLGCS